MLKALLIKRRELVDGRSDAGNLKEKYAATERKPASWLTFLALGFRYETDAENDTSERN